MEKYIYPNSIRNHGCGKAFILRDEEGKEWFVNCGMPRPLDHATAEYLRREFPWCAPSRVLGLKKTIAAEDFLGAAGDALLRSFRGTDAIPVPVHLSPLELACTERSYADALDAATFAAYREGYMQPWGAEATVTSEVEAALALLSGYTIITLDLRNTRRIFDEPDDTQADFYLNQEHKLAGETMKFDFGTLRRCYQSFGAAVELAAQVYQRHILGSGADFALSLSNMNLPTTAEEHYYIASELRRRGVVIQAFAPRFRGEFPLCGEFRGEAEKFGEEVKLHAAIAKQFGYKLSFPGCSYKLRILPNLGLESAGYFHTDTDGLAWISALRLAAKADPSLFRRCLQLCQESVGEAAQLFPLTVNLGAIPEASQPEDFQLPGLIDREEVRQLLYICHGHLLHAPLKDELLRLCRERQEEYDALVMAAVHRQLAYLDFG